MTRLGRVESNGFVAAQIIALLLPERFAPGELGIATGLPIGHPLKHQCSVFHAGFSPDGTLIVTSSNDNTARIWDAATGLPLCAPLAHNGPGHHASFTLDGSRIITAGPDHTARIWDADRFSEMFQTSDYAAFTSAVAGIRFDEVSGLLTEVPWSERQTIWNDLKDRIPAEWRWAAGEWAGPLEPVSPRSQITVRDAATRLLLSGHAPLIFEARGADPSHPLIPIVLAAEDDNENRQNFLRHYATRHLPTDSNLCRLAAKLLAGQGAKPEASIALQRAIELDPGHSDLAEIRALIDAL